MEKEIKNLNEEKHKDSMEVQIEKTDSENSDVKKKEEKKEDNFDFLIKELN